MSETVQELAVWQQVAHLSIADFPLRVYFLDKSASMRFDPFTHMALGLAALNALSPTRGSSLTFMLSAPGETQVFFRRPSDPPLPLSIRLGSSTWVNEPILQTLQALAPRLEALGIASWASSHGEPPVQVVCVTDGQDNCSPTGLRNLSGLVSAIKEITGPLTNSQVYRPMADPKELCCKDAIIGKNASQVPVWLCWLAMGSAGQQFLRHNASRDVALVNASVPGGGCNSTMRISSSNSDFGVGSRVGVKRPSWEPREPMSIIPANQIRDAIVVDVSEATSTYTVMYDDDIQETEVDSTRFAKGDQPTDAKPDVKFLMALSLVEAATTEPRSLMKLGTLDIWKEGQPEKVLAKANMRVELLERALMTKLRKANELVGLELCLPPPPEGFIPNFMTSIGSTACLPSWSQQERNLGQKIMYAALMQLLQGCTVFSSHLSRVCGDYCGILAADFVAQRGLDERSLDSWLDELALPALQAMNFLVAAGVLGVCEAIVDCENEDCLRCRRVPQKAFVLSDTSQSISALATLCRFLKPTWDALERCCIRRDIPWNRQRPHPVSPVSGGSHQELPLNRNVLRVSGVALAQPGLRRTSLSVSKTCLMNGGGSCSAPSRPGSESTTRIEKYRCRSSPVLWSGEVGGINRSCLRKSGSFALAISNASGP